MIQQGVKYVFFVGKIGIFFLNKTWENFADFSTKTFMFARGGKDAAFIHQVKNKFVKKDEVFIAQLKLLKLSKQSFL